MEICLSAGGQENFHRQELIPNKTGYFVVGKAHAAIGLIQGWAFPTNAHYALRRVGGASQWRQELLQRYVVTARASSTRSTYSVCIGRDWGMES